MTRCRSLLKLIIVSTFLSIVATAHASAAPAEASIVKRGRYLATIGACSACHTPPRVTANAPDSGSITESAERAFRTDPDWTRYLDPDRPLAGGVPFWMRFSGISHGVVYSRNLTPDPDTGLGTWSDGEILRVLREGVRKDGSILFLFPPHSFFKNLAVDDSNAIVAYLRTLKSVRNEIPQSNLPFPTQPASATTLLRAPSGSTPARAEYLMRALIGCRECHSHTKDGIHHEFVGGDPADPFTGVFRFGPDLPLRVSERGFANFPYPGFGITYAGNLTRYGRGGPLAATTLKSLVKAIKTGVSPRMDEYGRPIPLNHIMLWQYYRKMESDDVRAIAKYIRKLDYDPHEVPPLELFGTDWAAAFERLFKEQPTVEDRKFFGK